ncbi:glycosyltransferase family 2 protein [Alteromonas sp. ASW11-130]|uniref:glycosyltransferase family 2 protein n=1 Tax=Alteromonas sp. ASW11-130 TaxID=3015775 RepID=UPI00224243C9|nr:galactosyltransferase-related protein [Alteromonas sp. ASW11-130]MCW8092739.1 galactosyltransferase-related protein [Alteromonas sp. ASW11-130]
MKNELSISVVVIVKTRTQQLVRLIKQFEESSLPPNELVVVWMSSPSDFSLLKSEHFPIVHKFESTGGLEIARARNKGLSAATSSHCLYLNVESVISPLLLEQFAKTWTERCVLTTKVFCVEKTLLDSPFAEIEANYHRVGCIGEHKTFSVNNNPSMFFIAKRDVDSIGGFDENYSGFGINDEDFYQTCLKAGLVMEKVDTITFIPNREHYQCPINHLVDFVRNAELFHQKWGHYPCRDVLSRFADLGLINDDFQTSTIHVLRLPTEEERRAYEFSTLLPPEVHTSDNNKSVTDASMNNAIIHH